MREESFRTKLLRILASGFGTGYFPVVPGTVGTLVGIPLYMLLAPLGVVPVFLALILLVFVGIHAAGCMEREKGIKDPGTVVVDEIAGYLLTMIGSPVTFFHIAAGFFLFRLFDIVKPPPVRQAENRFSGGTGIMIDDLLAACYAWLCLRGMEALFY